MQGGSGRPVIELLQAHHDRANFDCGSPDLNRFLREQARQNADRNVGVTYVATPVPGDSRILGYYTLVTRIVDSSVIPEGRRLPRGPIGVVLLGRLAVDKAAQRQGLGARMLLRAIRQTETAAREVGVYALVLDAVDDAARDWYLGLGFGFHSLLDDPRHLYLSVATIRQLQISTP